MGEGKGHLRKKKTKKAREKGRHTRMETTEKGGGRTSTVVNSWSRGVGVPIKYG